jgi:uncharacterized protein YlxP (DUF503 family)
MVVGVLRIVLALPFNDSLKGKRSIVRRVVERARERFHVAAAEVEDLDAHRRAVLGFAVVSNDRRHATSILDQLGEFIATATEAEVVERRMELSSYGARAVGESAPRRGAALRSLEARRAASAGEVPPEAGDSEDDDGE